MINKICNLSTFFFINHFMNSFTKSIIMKFKSVIEISCWINWISCYNKIGESKGCWSIVIGSVSRWVGGRWVGGWLSVGRWNTCLWVGKRWVGGAPVGGLVVSGLLVVGGFVIRLINIINFINTWGACKEENLSFTFQCKESFQINHKYFFEQFCMTKALQQQKLYKIW